ncbi:hypothetical protein OOK31_29455 [Streptomyces sp. NBC_00249]|uniref:hypothetical protein n=1 Tax=Streptomyces sp. NBC_00249 TaxID=2975690 RepID=UPI002258BFAF|nr:hypothetical protein [Streptomyces sp. NBC_00249]MCX5197970.1 hypothetical protein [Streptomyces sp. NBC_00249]
MRTHHAVPVALAVAALLALTGCQDAKPSGADGAGPAPAKPAASASASASASAPAKGRAPVLAKQGTIPDLVGKGLQAAQDQAQAAGFYRLASHDSLGRGRAQAFDRNWKVCFQSPGPGVSDTDVRIDFGAVQLEETCPASDPGLPSAAPGTMPDFFTKSVKAARAALPSNTSFTVKDAREDRMVLQETNWQVCAQLPKPGTPFNGQPVELHVVKFGELCS